MSNWLDLSDNANCFESMYVKGFVDMSGGSLQLRNADNHLLVGGDASFNGGVYLEQNLLIGTETGHSGYAADISGIVDISGNLFTQGDVSMNGNLYVSGDCNIDGALSFGSASISASNISFSSDISLNERLFVNVSDVSYTNITGYLTKTVIAENPSTTLLTSIYGDAAGDWLGWSSTINGDGTIVAFGARYGDNPNAANNNEGFVKVYRYINSAWSQMGLTIYGDGLGDWLGSSVSLNDDGTRIACGGNYGDSSGTDNKGYIKVFEFDNNTSDWIILGSTIYGVSSGERLGVSVSLNNIGDIVIGGNAAGTARIYQYNSGWSNIHNISGYSDTIVSTNGNGDIFALGCIYESAQRGTVRVYQNVNNNITQLGNTFTGNSQYHWLGASISLNNAGTIIAMGAPAKDGNYGAGYVIIYEYKNSAWTILGSTINGQSTGDKFGQSVSLNYNGDIISIGAIGDDNSNNNSGSISIYQYNNDNNTWVYKTIINGINSSDEFGYFNSINNIGSIISIGARYYDYNSMSNSGAGFVYEIETNEVTTDTPIYQKIHSDVNSSGTFSSDISLNNTMIVPSNITIVDSSSNNYGSYTVYTDKAATNFFSVGKSASNVFNIVDQDNAGVYMASGSTSLTSTSDARLKTAIEPLEDATDKLMQLKPCTYKWKTQDEADPKKHVGFIAQEVEALFPNLVNENTYPDGSTYKGVATTDLIPYLIKSIQENQKTINYLKLKLEDLEK